MLPLQPGRNVLLLKVYNERLDWSFCLRVLGAKALEQALWQASKNGDLDKMETILNHRRAGRQVVRIDARSKYGLHGLDAYVGKYDYGQRQAIMTVSREGNQLYAQIKGQPKYEIFPKSETVFFGKAVPAQIAFVKDAHGKVTGGIHDQGGRKLDVPRIEDESRAH